MSSSYLTWDAASHPIVMARSSVLLVRDPVGISIGVGREILRRWSD
jgi:hypothetical protein